MSLGLSPRLATPMMVEPWLDLFLPAILGESRLFEAAVEQITYLPTAQRGDAWAVAARGRLFLGRDADAWSAYEAAGAYGGEEVEALATFLLGGGAKRCVQRAEKAASAGLAADAMCDAASLAMATGDFTAAVAAIRQARAHLPEHREALHWERFLAEPDAARAWVRACISPDSQPLGRAARDAVHLCPRRDAGFVSQRRLTDRCYSKGNAVYAPVGSGLRRLFDAGRSGFILATEPDWAAVPSNHELVAAELVIGQVEDLVDEARPAFAEARRAWDQAVNSEDAIRIDDVGQALCALATRGSELAPVAREAAERLRLRQDGGEPLFSAYAALFSANSDPAGATAAAEGVLHRAQPGILPFTMAIATLRKTGEQELIHAALAARTRDPVLAETARLLADARRPALGTGVICSPRLTPRGLRAENAPRIHPSSS